MSRPPHFLRVLKLRFQRFAQKPYASVLLFLMAFIESSAFPIAPDFLLIPLCVARPRRALKYAAVCVAGSTCGAIAGYYLGSVLFSSVGRPIISLFGWGDQFRVVLSEYAGNVWKVLLLAGFTPIPFQLFSMAAGFNRTIPLGLFIAATLAGRCVRFFLVGGLFRVFGDTVQHYLDRYLGWVSIAVLLLLMLWFVLVRGFF